MTGPGPAAGLVVIACSARKLDLAAPARALYTGDLFRASVTWAESWHQPWVVLSAAHGIISPDRVVAPYNARLAGRHPHRVSLIVKVARQLRENADRQDARFQALTVLGGEPYVDVILEA